jgi:hypothetical protein
MTEDHGYQKTPLRSEINVYTPNSTVIRRRTATKKMPPYVASQCGRSAAKVFSRNVLSE